MHLDHAGDFPAYYLTGPVNNRLQPLRVWGPNGARPGWGTKAWAAKMEEMWAWEVATRGAAVDPRGLELEVNEFDWTALNNIIFDENGVVVRTVPAIHGEQSVSFILEWNGLRLAFSGDTLPNKWWINNTQGVDLSIHECFFTPESLGRLLGTPPAQAIFITSYIHTPPDAFGKIMSTIKPRHAIGYHFWTWHDIYAETLEAVRATYDGPLTLADDMTVWNVTDEKVVVREAILTEDVAPTGTTQAYRTAKREPPEVAQDWISPDINAGKWDGYTPPPLPRK